MYYDLFSFGPEAAGQFLRYQQPHKEDKVDVNKSYADEIEEDKQDVEMVEDSQGTTGQITQSSDAVSAASKESQDAK